MTNTSNKKTTNQVTAQNLKNWNYEATVTQIEEIINKIESGKLELAEVFEQFSTATEYLQQCETFLSERQQQMNLLIEPLVNESAKGEEP